MLAAGPDERGDHRHHEDRTIRQRRGDDEHTAGSGARRRVTFRVTLAAPPAPNQGPLLVRDFLGANYALGQGLGSDLCTPIATPLTVPTPPFTSANDVGTVLDCQLPGGTTSFTLTAQVVTIPAAGNHARSWNAACVFGNQNLNTCAQAQTLANLSAISKSVQLVDGHTPSRHTAVGARGLDRDLPDPDHQPTTGEPQPLQRARFPRGELRGAKRARQRSLPSRTAAAHDRAPGFGNVQDVGIVLDCQIPGGTTQFTLTAQVKADAVVGASTTRRVNVACLFGNVDLNHCASAETLAQRTLLSNRVVAVGPHSPTGVPPVAGIGETVGFQIDVENPPPSAYLVREFLGGNFLIGASQGSDLLYPSHRGGADLQHRSAPIRGWRRRRDPGLSHSRRRLALHRDRASRARRGVGHATTRRFSVVCLNGNLAECAVAETVQIPSPFPPTPPTVQINQFNTAPPVGSAAPAPFGAPPAGFPPLGPAPSQMPGDAGLPGRQPFPAANGPFAPMPGAAQSPSGPAASGSTAASGTPAVASDSPLAPPATVGGTTPAAPPTGSPTAADGSPLATVPEPETTTETSPAGPAPPDGVATVEAPPFGSATAEPPAGETAPTGDDPERRSGAGHRQSDGST